MFWALPALGLRCCRSLYGKKTQLTARFKAKGDACMPSEGNRQLTPIAVSVIGTGLHYAVGAWQADPVAGLLIGAYLVREGREAFSERRMCC